MTDPQSPSDGPFLWPTTRDQAIELLDVARDGLLPPMVLALLREWGEMKRRLRRKALSMRALGSMQQRLAAAGGESAAEVPLAGATPQEAFALLTAISQMRAAPDLAMLLMHRYADLDDMQLRLQSVVATKALDWLASQRHLDDVDDLLGIDQE